MTTKQKKLAAYFLNLAADSYSNHGCNDLDQEAIDAAAFTPEESAQFGIDMEQWNSEGRDEPPKFENMPDWLVMRFLAELLQREIGESEAVS
jgi:hypothetical protein